MTQARLDITKTKAVLKCTCQHTVQDKIHGKGLREYHLQAVIYGNDDTERYYRCQTCGAEKTLSGQERVS